MDNVLTGGAPGLKLEHGEKRNAALWLALLLLACFAPFLFMLQISHDAAWQMWIARQLVHGVNLYSDIIENNPPLWFWIAAPLSIISNLLGVGELKVLVDFFIACTVASLLLSNRLLHFMPHWRRAFILIAFVLMALPPANLCQREDFTFIVVTPYVILIGLRRSGSSVSPRLAAVVGLAGAFGFALKPHFALVPMMLELWLRKSIVRPETIVLAAFATIYAVAVPVFELDYLTKMLPLVREAYDQFGGFSLAALLLTITPFVVALIARPGRDALSGALLVTSLTFYLIYVAQLKGFFYQVIPAMGMLVLALAASSSWEINVRNAVAFFAAVMATLPNLSPYRTPPWIDVPEGASYAAFSVGPRGGWPLVVERRLRWPLRTNSLWMAPALGTRVHDWVVKDLQCNPPTYLVVDDRQLDFSSMFRDVVADYEVIGRNGKVTMMKLARNLPKSPGSCRPVY